MDSYLQSAELLKTIDKMAQAHESLAIHLKYLGTGDAGTTMGAVEFLAVSIKEGCSEVASALNNVAEAIREREE